MLHLWLLLLLHWVHLLLFLELLLLHLLHVGVHLHPLTFAHKPLTFTLHLLTLHLLALVDIHLLLTVIILPTTLLIVVSLLSTVVSVVVLPIRLPTWHVLSSLTTVVSAVSISSVLLEHGLHHLLEHLLEHHHHVGGLHHLHSRENSIIPSAPRKPTHKHFLQLLRFILLPNNFHVFRSDHLALRQLDIRGVHRCQCKYIRMYGSILQSIRGFFL